MSALSRSQSLGVIDFTTATAEALAVRAGRGDATGRECFGVLIERYQGRLFNFLLRRVRSRQDAEDLTQEAFVRAWERAGTYNPRWRFSTWLFTIATRLAITNHRRSRRLGVVTLAEPVEATNHAAATDRPGSGVWGLASACLSDDQHTAVWLRYAEDLSIEEIAVVMGKSQVAVRVCLFRARKALAERLNEVVPDDELLMDSEDSGGKASWPAALGGAT